MLYVDIYCKNKDIKKIFNIQSTYYHKALLHLSYHLHSSVIHWTEVHWLIGGIVLNMKMLLMQKEQFFFFLWQGIWNAFWQRSLWHFQAPWRSLPSHSSLFHVTLPPPCWCQSTKHPELHSAGPSSVAQHTSLNTTVELGSNDKLQTSGGALLIDATVWQRLEDRDLNHTVYSPNHIQFFYSMRILLRFL